MGEAWTGGHTAHAAARFKRELSRVRAPHDKVDATGETSDSDLVLAQVGSTYDSCGSRHLGMAAFAIDNGGSDDVVLVGIDFDGATSGGSLAFAAGLTVAAGEDGEHVTRTSFDNCDTGLPDIEVRPCAVVAPISQP